MRFYVAEWQEKEHKAAYRLYMATCTQLIAQSVCGIRIQDYAEIIGKKKIDNRTGDEIALDVIKKAGLEIR